jgi:hypothetical protein
MLPLPNDKLKEYASVLAHYKYVSELDKLKYGGYIRWIEKKDSNYVLKKGMFVCDIIIGDEGIVIKGKIFGGRFLNIRMNECFIFQKLSNEEIIINSAINALEK